MRVDSEAMRVTNAQNELEGLILKFANENDLTDIEVFQALTSYMQSSLKYQLRYERHGNYDTPAMWPVEE